MMSEEELLAQELEAIIGRVAEIRTRLDRIITKEEEHGHKFLWLSTAS
jgi:hypothetical protein